MTIGEVINTFFEKNDVKSSNTYSTLYATGNIDLISGSTFLANTSKAGATAIYAGNIKKLENSIFRYNISTNSVGAVSASIEQLSSSDFLRNSAFTSGGAIYGRNLGTIYDTYFYSNYAPAGYCLVFSDFD